MSEEEVKTQEKETPTKDPSHSFRCSDQLWEEFNAYCQEKFSSRTQEIVQFMQYCVMKHKLESGVVPDAVQSAIDSAVDKAVENHSVSLLQEILGAMKVKAKQDSLMEKASRLDTILGDDME